MCQTGWIGNDNIRNKWTATIIHRITPWVLFYLVQMCAIARLEARSPTPIKYLLHLSTALLDCATPDRTHIREQPGILDHECHQFCRVTSDIEELQLGIEDGVSKG
jgi:hypothetical protein